MTKSRLLKLGGAALAAVGAGSGVVNTIINVVEVINYEDHYEINTSTKYYIDGQEVDLMTYNELTGFDVGYGKLDNLENISLDNLTAVRLNGTSNTFTCKIACGNSTTEEGEYPVFAVPATYSISSLVVSGFDVSANLDSTVVDGYNVYVYNIPVYDEDIGGETWTVTLDF